MDKDTLEKAAKVAIAKSAEMAKARYGTGRTSCCLICVVCVCGTVKKCTAKKFGAYSAYIHGVRGTRQAVHDTNRG
jgi:hypothetical protein